MAIPPGINLRHIDCFLAVAEHGTITGAAEARNISQPALSKTIADLEQRLGARLFERMGRRTVLSPEGEGFRRYATMAVRSLEAGVEVLNGPARKDVIVVGLLPTVAGGLFPSVSLEFLSLHRDVQISVLTGPNDYLLNRLRAGEIDLMVGRMPAAADMAGLNFELLFEDRIVLTARKGHPMQGASPTDVLQRHPLILPNPGAIIRENVEKYLNVIGIPNLRPTLETVSLAFAKPILENSDMAWFISHSVVARALEDGSLISFDLNAEFMAGAVGMTTRSSQEPNYQLDYLMDLLRDKSTAQQDAQTDRC